MLTESQCGTRHHPRNRHGKRGANAEVSRGVARGVRPTSYDAAGPAGTRKYRGAWREVSGQRATMRRDRPAAMMASTVLDPFMGNGATGPAALRHHP